MATYDVLAPSVAGCREHDGAPEALEDHDDGYDERHDGRDDTHHIVELRKDTEKTYDRVRDAVSEVRERRHGGLIEPRLESMTPEALLEIGSREVLLFGARRPCADIFGK